MDELIMQNEMMRSFYNVSLYLKDLFEEVLGSIYRTVRQMQNNVIEEKELFRVQAETLRELCESLSSLNSIAAKLEELSQI